MSQHKPALAIFRFPLEHGWGGEERVHLQLAQALREQDTETIIVSSDPALRAGFIEHNFRAYPITFVRDLTSKWMLLCSPVIIIMFVLQLLPMLVLLKLRRTQTVLCLTLLDKLFATPLIKLFGIDVVWSHHAQIGPWLTKNPFLFLYKWWARLWQIPIIVPSEMVKSDLEKIAADLNIAVVPNPLGREFGTVNYKLRITNDATKDFTVGSCGRLSADKNVPEILEIAKQLPEVQFLLAGDGPQRAELKETAPKNVQLLGRLEAQALPEFYQSCDLMLFASETETFGLVALEASSQGTAVIAKAAGGWLESVVDNQTGFHYTDLNDALTKIKQLQVDPKFCKRLGHNGKQFATGFTEEKFVQQMREVLELSRRHT